MGLRSLWRKTKNVAGDAAVYGSVPFTGGASLLAKKGARDTVGNAWNDVTGVTASRDAARIQQQAADRATQYQQEALNKNIELNKPWYDAGVSALGDLAGGLKSGAFDAPQEQFQYSMPDEKFSTPEFKFDFKADPGYQYRLDQANKATERSAAARGGLFSGATMSDLARQSGDMASQEYGNAFDRARSVYQNDRNFGYDAFRDRVSDSIGKRDFAYNDFTNQQNQKRNDLNARFSRLSTLAGLGEAATSRQGAAQSTFGQQAGDNAIGAGNARAAGRTAQYNNQRDFITGLGGLAAQGVGYALGGPVGGAAARAALPNSALGINSEFYNRWGR